MPKKITMISLGLLIMLLLSACFKSAGSDRPESQPVVVIANVTTSQSATEEATEEIGVQPVGTTMIPTTEVAAQATTPVPVTPSATNSPTASPTITPSLTPSQTIPPVQPLASSTPGAGQSSVLTNPPTQETVPSSTPSATSMPPTNTATSVPPTNTVTSVPPTNTATLAPPTNLPTATVTPIEQQQIPFTTVPLVQVASFTPAVATADTAGQIVVQPTEVSDAGLQVAPAQQTATQIIANATSTAAAQQTIAAGGQVQPPLAATTPAGIIVTQPGVVQPTVAGQPAATQICQQEYMVRIGDTLSQIARTYNVTIQALATANNIVNPDLIRAGYPIVIPCPSPATPTPTATLPAAGQGGGAASNATGPFTYTVVAGDNIYRLSLRYGVTMLAILQANPAITDMNFISEGQEIIIPGPPTTTSQTGTTTQPIATAPVIPTAQVIQPTQAIIQPTQQFQPLFTPTWTPATTG